ncbi:MAG TPA: hypothetical protein VIL49_07085, partial [Capillimicrobium sp.]
GDDRLAGRGGGDGLGGGAGRDVLLGGGGDDDLASVGGGRRDARELLSGGPGSDELVGTKGAERFVGGPGRDNVEGERGADRVDVDGGGPDIVACRSFGRQLEARVRADGADLVQHCGAVRRSSAPRLWVGSTGTVLDEFEDGRHGWISLWCSQDMPHGGCRGTVGVALRGDRPRPETEFHVRPGRYADELPVPLPREARRRLERCGQARLVFLVRAADGGGRVWSTRRHDLARLERAEGPSC